MPISARRAGYRYRSPWQDDFHNVTADLVRDRLSELARGLRAEGRLYATRAATISRELEDDLRHAGVIFEHLLYLLEECDGALIVEDFPEANNEGGRLIEFGKVPR